MIAFSGDLDLDAVTRIDPVELLPVQEQAVTLDLSDVMFTDSSGINLLIKLRLRAEEVGATTRLIGANAHVTSTLRHCGLLEFLGVREP